MASESKRKANAKYDKSHCTGVYLKLNNETDKDILEKLSSVPNVQGYIKQLIRQDISPVPVSNPVPEPFKDPFSDTIAKAVGTWIDSASSILTDNRPYIVSNPVPNTTEEA